MQSQLSLKEQEYQNTLQTYQKEMKHEKQIVLELQHRMLSLEENLVSIKQMKDSLIQDQIHSMQASQVKNILF